MFFFITRNIDIRVEFKNGRIKSIQQKKTRQKTMNNGRQKPYNKSLTSGEVIDKLGVLCFYFSSGLYISINARKRTSAKPENAVPIKLVTLNE